MRRKVSRLTPRLLTCTVTCESGPFTKPGDPRTCGYFEVRGRGPSEDAKQVTASTDR